MMVGGASQTHAHNHLSDRLIARLCCVLCDAGACIQCFASHCISAFHVMCAHRAGLRLEVHELPASASALAQAQAADEPAPTGGVAMAAFCQAHADAEFDPRTYRRRLKSAASSSCSFAAPRCAALLAAPACHMQK
jgi:hypothetical protein